MTDDERNCGAEILAGWRRARCARIRVPSPTSALIVDVGGFEGPLDLLLELARHHKVDLAQISILALAEQYLAFIENARKCALNSPPTIW